MKASERPQQSRVLRRSECEAATGLSYWTLKRMAKRGEFPAPIRLSAGAMGWVEDEVLAWRNSRPRTVYPAGK
jgi:prophage regulatory protein